MRYSPPENSGLGCMEPNRRKSLILWTLLGALLICSSYLFTLGLALACFALILTTNAVLMIGGPIIGLTILWSLLPRRDKFVAPGPVIRREDAPRLFAELDRIALQLNEDMPADVYLLADLNAWVAERGGFLGFGRRRVMGIGLPVLGALSVAELRGVLAHEFGHYYRGDTRLGPWLYQARAGMIRTLRSLGEPNVVLQVAARFLILYVVYRVVIFLLVGYWKLFLRITLFMSRKQEFRADELAARISGAEAFSRGLRCIVGGEGAVDSYWKSEIGLALGAGYRPPIAAGFAAFLSAPNVSRAVTQSLESRLKEEKTEAFSTHPPLRDRLARLAEFPSDVRTSPEDDALPATALFDHLDRFESELLYLLKPDLRQRNLQAVDWMVARPKVLLDIWTKSVARVAPCLQSVTVECIPAVISDLAPLAALIPDPPGMLLDREQRTERAVEFVGCALALVLLQQGWILTATPGECHFTREQVSVNPFDLVSDLAAKTCDQASWIRRVTAMGIASCPLISATQIATA
jgi:heat shock protein HtpX